MSKEKFLERLRKKLSILESSEIDDIINEYDGYIEEKIKKGFTEEEAVKSMGEVDELAKELLSAYKIKTDGENHGSINNLIDSFIHIFDQIVSMFADKSFNEIIKFILEIVCIFIIIAICRIPFEIIGSIGRGFLSVFSTPIYHVFASIWSFILNVVYLIFAILLFVKIFESRYLGETTNFVIQNKKEKKEEPIEEMKEEKKIVSKKGTLKEKKQEVKSFGIVDSLVKVCLLFLKFILLFVLLGVACYIVGMSVAIGLSIYLLIRGVFYFGIYLILFALFTLGILAFLFLFNFIFDRKNRVGVLLILSLISFIALGVGAGVCTLEVANTTIIYSEDKENIKTEEYRFKMNDQLVLSSYIYDTQDIIIDDSLDDEIKVVYSYNDRYLSIQTNPSIDKNDSFDVLRMRYYIKGVRYSKEFFDEIIENLKNKTFVARSFDQVDIKLYMSSKTKEQLLENEKKYEDYFNDYECNGDCFYFGHNRHYREYCRGNHCYYE